MNASLLQQRGTTPVSNQDTSASTKISQLEMSLLLQGHPAPTVCPGITPLNKYLFYQSSSQNSIVLPLFRNNCATTKCLTKGVVATTKIKCAQPVPEQDFL